MHYVGPAECLLGLLVLLSLYGRGLGRTLIYQRDVSEYCRRRALPSVFLGKRVVEANAQMMHFSRLELPYNCFIAIRAETGTHIILVVQLLPGESLDTSCKGEGDQLLVYEMGETFGGYWGQVPVELVRRPLKASPRDQTRSPPSAYTLKTTRKATKPTKRPETTTEARTIAPLLGEAHTRVRTQQQEQVWTDVVPLMNLSLHILPSDTEVRHRINSDDAFDAFYDVTPVPGESYRTSIVPLVQFSLSGLKDERRGGRDGGDTSAPLFDLVYNFDDKSASETRTKPHLFRNLMHKHKTTRRVEYFRTFARSYETKRVLQSTTVSRQPTLGSSPSQSLLRSRLVSPIATNRFQYNQNQLTGNDLSTEARNDTTARDSWLDVMDLMNILKNRASTSDLQLDKTNDKQSELLRKISQIEPNTSVYLEPDLDTYRKNHEEKMKQLNNITVNSIAFSNPSEGESTSLPATKGLSVDAKRHELNNYLLAVQNISSTNMTTMTKLYELNGINNSLENITDESTTQIASYENNTGGLNGSLGKQDAKFAMRHIFTEKDRTPSTETTLRQSTTINATEISSRSTNALKPITGPLVGHESWDNVVNVAPKMEMVLNNTNHTMKYNNSSRFKSRKERAIQALEVENSKPHAMFQRLVTHTAHTLSSSPDMYGFSPVVEPRDDEVYGRIHLRYVRRLIGPPIFNLCNYTHEEPKIRQVLLFNSSRILIGISNFTLKRMTLVATSARTLESVTARCPPNHLECQVSGARVCIDSSSACDGVPNCGAFDIYDEDRLACGASHGLHHNVYLAAFTFLAVLMTVCYSVHYWLKRCVPQVSEAFFVYTNGAENVLYLDSIMKSPTDTDDLSKMFYQGPILEDDYLRESKDRRSTFRKMMDRISVFFQRKPDVTLDLHKRESRHESKRMYSFTELELNKFTFKITTDMSVQTGESLEMQTFTQQPQKHAQSPKANPTKETRHSVLVTEDREYVSELPEVTSMMEPKRDLQAIKLLKLLREARGSLESAKVARSATTGAGTIVQDEFSEKCSTSEERELRNLLYDFPASMRDSTSSLIVAYDPGDIRSRAQLHTGQPTPETSSMKKCLRFEEVATVIPSPQYEMTEESKQILDGKSDVSQPSGEVSGIDFKRFWNIKPKKPKTKGHISLREK